MKEFFEIIAGIIIAVSSGFLVKYVLDHAVPKDIRPKGINKQLQKLWVSIQSEDLKKPGKWLGGLERLLSLSAVRTGHYEIVAGWLAFKVASKWQVWASVFKQLEKPTVNEKITENDLIKFRRILGGRIMMRFLIGTLCNILFGFAAAYIGKHSWEMIQFANGLLLPALRFIAQIVGIIY